MYLFSYRTLVVFVISIFLFAASVSTQAQSQNTKILPPILSFLLSESEPTELTFDTPGVFEFVVPEGITSLGITISGASGGNAAGGIGGLGAKFQGSIAVTSGEELVITVGGQGQAGQGAGDSGGGGALSAILSENQIVVAGAGAGGGSTDDGGDGGSDVNTASSIDTPSRLLWFFPGENGAGEFGGRGGADIGEELQPAGSGSGRTIGGLGGDFGVVENLELDTGAPAPVGGNGGGGNGSGGGGGSGLGSSIGGGENSGGGGGGSIVPSGFIVLGAVNQGDGSIIITY